MAKGKNPLMPLDDGNDDSDAAAVEELVDGDDAVRVMVYELKFTRLFDIGDLFNMNMRRRRTKCVAEGHPGRRIRHNGVGEPNNVLSSPPPPPLVDCWRRCRFIKLECAQENISRFK